ncbi:sigma-54-dependent transcriptional regulator [Parabacteroides goldsteinii]|jgi:two-component system NtrC family response regulator|uniref:sigma-54-dependent transcriptional regulator n=1 Tax=Parabacteroides goldsteinii TaxID=328812 RepID=UPI001D3D6526|nr:sigma-54 dependent transcriptional regulator [Parabacteroides goldsteinii]MBS6577387.1 sigma-54-dependent Fis family transcriptional regulator [Parabacteroides goldsteinii]
MILICDDDTTVRTSLTLVLKRAGYEVATAANQQEAIDFVRHTCPQLILMDMNYSNTTTGEEGLELLAKVQVFCPAVPVILITAWGSINLAVQGIRAGAFDFITKPWNNLALLKTIETAIQLRDSKEKNPDPKNGKTERTDRFDKIIGRSPLLQQVLNTISRISQTNAPVLITGESGTGKELIAEAIHENSGRQGKPFIKVNLGGISQSLFESEMFGHKQGAFTDARHDRTGRFELADKGTIFLDEIGELDLVCQVKLLRVLQDQTFEPLGESKPRQVDTRIICATNKNLPEMVAQGTFREDLFYRINLITIQMPALRERPEDIPLLVEYFARKQAEQNNLPEAEISQEAFGYLKKLPFHGNIRELKNLVERTILISGKDVITDIDFKQQYIEVPASQPAGGNTILSLEMVERNMIQKAVELYGCNHSRIAAALGLSRQTLYRRLEKYDIKLPE